MQDYSEIQNAFLDGLNEVFTTMFTDKLELCLLDEVSTKKNVYDETPNKVYLPPVQLVGRIQTYLNKGEDPVETIQVDAVITIPTKQLISNSIPHYTDSDLETLKKAKFVYCGFEYLIEKVTPKTLIADKWQIYDFVCSMDKKSSLSKG